VGWKRPAVAPGPSGLLRPDRKVVEFTGRMSEQAVLGSWCASADDRSLRIVTGPGGTGKTRLALQAAAGFAANRGRWWLVAAGDEAQAVAAARAQTSGPVLLVVDNADARTGLAALLWAMARDQGRIRVLLLSRALGEWWGRLAEDSAAAARGLLAEAAPMRLAEPLLPQADDDALARAALPYFAQALQVPVPWQVKFGLPARRVPALLLHAAALAAVLRSAAAPAAAVRLEVGPGVLAELLEHEARYWQRAARAAGLSTDGTVLRQVTAAAALLGSRDQAETAQLAGRVPGLAGASRARRRSWAHWLHELYPPAAAGELGSVQPDLLAETHVVTQLTASPGLASGCLRDLTGAQAGRALTMLGRALAHQAGAGDLIVAALHADLARLALPAAQVAQQASSGLGGLLAGALPAAPCPPEALLNLAAALPYPSAVLAPAHLAATRRVVTYMQSLPPDTEPQPVAEWRGWAGVRLAQLGEPAEALAVTREAVTIRRELAAADPGRHGSGLAEALITLGSRLAAVGRGAEAMAVTEEAVAVGRELAAADPGRPRPELALALHQLARFLVAAGGAEEAVPVAREAAALRRELAAVSPEEYRSDLAESLHDLGLWLVGLDRHEQAVPLIAEAVVIRREQAAASLGRHGSDLAGLLYSLGRSLAELGRFAEAVPVTEEAVTILRELAAGRPGRYRRYLADSLASLSVILASLGQGPEAEQIRGEAERLRA
jgi:tetratricopeptide (TPR) repeat protein